MYLYLFVTFSVEFWCIKHGKIVLNRSESTTLLLLKTIKLAKNE